MTELQKLADKMHEIYTNSFKVLSDLFTDKNAGDVVSQDELEGCNIPALIESGHIAALNEEADPAINTKEQ